MKFKILYHVTPLRNEKSIQKYGLRVGRNSPRPRLVMFGEKHLNTKIQEKRNILYFTDKAGVSVVIRGWVGCDALILKVKVPVTWLLNRKAEIFDYAMMNPAAAEWTVAKNIPGEYILAAWEYRC